MTDTPEVATLRAQRDAWCKACTKLYNACKNGANGERPMDRISKREWASIIQLIAEAETTE